MSVTEATNTIPPYVFEAKGEKPAPFTFDVPASLEIRPETATAKFDGTGAAGPFLACLTFYGSDGERLGRYFNPNPLKIGDVAEVTFTPPFGSAASSAATAAGIQFDTDNQGGWLDITTHNVDPGGRGVLIEDLSGGYTRIENGSQRLDLSRGGNIAVLVGNTASLVGNPANMQASGLATTNVVVQLVGGRGNVSAQVRGVGGSWTLGDTGAATTFTVNTGRLAFFNAVPVAKPNVTGSRGGNAALASLLTALANLGLITDSTTP